MKTLLYTFLLFFFLLSGCKREDKFSAPLLHAVEQLLPTYADSASVLLSSISAPDELDDETFVHWCMLSGKVTDETAAGLLPLYQWKRVQQWFMQHGTAEERAQVALYLGRAYVEDGEYDKAMEVYTNALELAQEHKEYNVAGYICTYIADVYDFRNITSECIKKREEASELFEKAKNYKSYAYALESSACEWALIDSFSYAMSLLQEADSISQCIENKDLIAAVANTSGIISEMQGKYDEAEKYYLKAIATSSEESYKDSIALAQVYIKSGELTKAHTIIEAVTKDEELSYHINETYYLLCKAEGKYEEALHYKDICSDILDSLTTAQNETKVLEIEKKYNNTKIREENELLKIAQQRNIMVIIIATSLFLLSVAGYIIYRQRAKAKIHHQQTVVNKLRIELLQLSLELKKKKQTLQNSLLDKEKYINKLELEIEEKSLHYNRLYDQLQEQEKNAEAKSKQQQEEIDNVKSEFANLSQEVKEKEQALRDAQADQERDTQQFREEVEMISQKYDQLQKQTLEASAIGKKLSSLTEKPRLKVFQTLSSDKAWLPIIRAVDKIYPRFSFLLQEACPDLTESERRYCYLHIFGFDGNEEATLLNINPDSVRTKRTRINLRMQKQPEKEGNLREYLIKYLLK